VEKSIELSLYSYIFQDDVNPYEYVLHANTIYNVENYLLNLLENFEKGCGIELKTQYGETIGKVMSYVLINYYKDINLNKVSEELNFNPSYLSTKFKEITQYSFNEYLNTIRINNAKKLMAERKYKFSQISNMVGYNDQRYFCKIFKKLVGITPKEYINALSYS
jgi:YesN/AraC family two-component response regulator